MATTVIWHNSFVVSHIESKFGMEVLWNNRHQIPMPHALLLWKLGCHGNQSKTSTTHLSYLSSYLLRRFFRVVCISHIPDCFENLVAMATRVKLLQCLCLKLYWIYICYGDSLRQQVSVTYIVAMVT